MMLAGTRPLPGVYGGGLWLAHSTCCLNLCRDDRLTLHLHLTGNLLHSPQPSMLLHFLHLYLPLKHFHFTFPPCLMLLTALPIHSHLFIFGWFSHFTLTPTHIPFLPPQYSTCACQVPPFSLGHGCVWDVLVQMAASSFWDILLGGWSLPQPRVRLCRPVYPPILSVTHQLVSTIVVFVFSTCLCQSLD